MFPKKSFVLFFFEGHRDRPTIVRYHPTADNILTSAGYDLSVNIWDVNKETTALSLGGHLEPVSNDGNQS
jgi:WD40 repeat protein